MPKAVWGDFSVVDVDLLETYHQPRPLPRPPVREVPTVYVPEIPGGMFEARYSGRCTSCGERIPKGGPMGYEDDEIVCEDCFTPYGER